VKNYLAGKYIKLKHPGNFVTVYAHCSQLMIKKGQRVKKGDIIAKVGSTGWAIGPHLHFEIWKDSKPYNPLSFIEVPKK
jgi:murein DD-endopeptidase MepM/ murein hydrolase activator NlpD